MKNILDLKKNYNEIKSIDLKYCNNIYEIENPSTSFSIIDDLINKEMNIQLGWILVDGQEKTKARKKRRKNINNK